MSKSQRRVPNQKQFERDEESRHHYKIQRSIQNRKITKELDRALRNKDYQKLIQYDEY